MFVQLVNVQLLFIRLEFVQLVNVPHVNVQRERLTFVCSALALSAFANSNLVTEFNNKRKKNEVEVEYILQLTGCIIRINGNRSRAYRTYSR